MTDLIAADEGRRWQVEAARPLEVVKTAMADRGLTQNDLASVIGSRARASEILRVEGRLSMAMVHRIGTAWSIPAGPPVSSGPVKRSAT